MDIYGVDKGMFEKVTRFNQIMKNYKEFNGSMKFNFIDPEFLANLEIDYKKQSVKKLRDDLVAGKTELEVSEYITAQDILEAVVYADKIDEANEATKELMSRMSEPFTVGVVSSDKEAKQTLSNKDIVGDFTTGESFRGYKHKDVKEAIQTYRKVCEDIINKLNPEGITTRLNNLTKEIFGEDLVPTEKEPTFDNKFPSLKHIKFTKEQLINHCIDKEVFLNACEDFKEMQLETGSKDYYGHGLYNGMEFVRATILGDDTDYISWEDFNDN